MPCPLPADCLVEVFENLEDKITLHSYLLVCRSWCEISVRTLWKDIWDFKDIITHRSSAILSILIACLPNDSKELLHNNEIFISTPTSKPPLFNYASFCKVLSIDEIGRIVDKGIKNNASITISSSNYKKYLVAKEILKMFMDQISSLKKLTYYTHNITDEISYFPRARDCLANLSELCCSSNIHFDQISQICHNLQSLVINFENEVSNSLKELVSSQNNLKNLILFACDDYSWEDIIPALAKHSNTLTKLQLYWYCDLPLSFV